MGGRDDHDWQHRTRSETVGTLPVSNKQSLIMRFVGCPWSFRIALGAALLGSGGSAAAAYTVSPDLPRIFVTRAALPDLARRCAGPLAADYLPAKAAAAAAHARAGLPAPAHP